MLILVDNWCSYENIQVHILFEVFFGKFLWFWPYLCQFFSDLYVFKFVLKGFFRTTKFKS